MDFPLDSPSFFLDWQANCKFQLNFPAFWALYEDTWKKIYKPDPGIKPGEVIENLQELVKKESKPKPAFEIMFL